MKRVLLFVVACGGSPSPPPAPAGPPASLIATPTHDDVEVAQVNGRPVWGSCVTAQAIGGVTREQALGQCVDFELLAQAAEARGYARDRDVALDTRSALVSQLVAHEFEDKYTRPIEFGDFWRRLADNNKWRLDHPEVRGSAYVRVQDEMISRQIAAALADERGLMLPHLKAIAERVVAGRTKLELAEVRPDVKEGRLDATYVGALFSIPEVGQVAAPVHTRWGWDIVLFESVIPEARPTADALAAQLLPDVKRSYFPFWVNKLAQSSGAKIHVYDKNVPLLENL